MPDGAMQIHNSKIYTSDSHWDARIESEFTHHGTLIYDVPVLHIVPNKIGDVIIHECSVGGVSSSGGKFKRIIEMKCDDISSELSDNNSNNKKNNKKRKRFTQNNTTILSSLDNLSQNKYDDSIIQSLDKSRLLSRRKVVTSKGIIIMHIGKDRNIYSLEIKFTAESKSEGLDRLWC
jgi:hypothetical protein